MRRPLPFKWMLISDDLLPIRLVDAARSTRGQRSVHPPTGPMSRCRHASPVLLDLGEPVGELDVGAPRISNECNRDVERSHLRKGPLELDAHAFEVLAERLEIPNLEANVIQRAALSADDRLRRW